MGFRQYQALDITGWKGSKRDQCTAELIRPVDRRLNPEPICKQLVKKK